MNNMTFWGVTPYSSVEINRRLNISPPSLGSESKVSKTPEISRLQAELCLRGLIFDREDGSDTFLRNIGGLPPNYTTLQPIISYSSNFTEHSPSWESNGRLASQIPPPFMFHYCVYINPPLNRIVACMNDYRRGLDW
jgi:hypothetical protein